MSAFSRNDLLAIAIIFLIAVVTLITLFLRDRRKILQAPPVYEGIDDLMHRSSEEGKTLLIGLGEGFSGMEAGIADLTGLMVQNALMNRVVFNDQPAQSFSADGALACISHSVVHGAYENALASELFRSDANLLTGIGGLPSMAGLIPELSRAENAGLVLVGSLRPESILISDLADRQDIPLIAASGSLAAQAAFFATSADLAIGEDYYLPSIGKQAYTQVSAKVLNALRWILVGALLFAAILKLSGVIP